MSMPGASSKFKVGDKVIYIGPVTTLAGRVFIVRKAEHGDRICLIGLAWYWPVDAFILLSDVTALEKVIYGIIP